MDLYYNQLNLIMLIDQTGFKGISVTYFSYLLDTFLILSLKLRNSNGGNIFHCVHIYRIMVAACVLHVCSN